MPALGSLRVLITNVRTETSAQYTPAFGDTPRVEVDREGQDLGTTAREELVRGHAQHTTDVSPPGSWRCQVGRRDLRPSRQAPAPDSGCSPVRRGRLLSRRGLRGNR